MSFTARYAFSIISAMPMPVAALHWYALLWARLTRRLKYGGKKAKSAERRLRVHWPREDVDKVVEEFKVSKNP